MDIKSKTEIYDAELTRIDVLSGLVNFRAEGEDRLVALVHQPHWALGTVGRLRLTSEDGSSTFFPYPDQRLRRHPPNDDPRLRLWGWRIEEQTFACKHGVIPGKDGLVFIQDTETVVLELPREFLELCRTIRLRPETVLQGFIADLCSLISWSHLPREDGYSSNGWDERRIAQAYFQRAYGWLSAQSRAE
jgi:hypothetical protein